MTLKQQLSSLTKPLLLACLMSGLTTPLFAVEATAENTAVKTIPLEEIRLFTEVFERIKNAYVEPVDDAKLLEDAVRGMLAGLDPHSAYLEPEAFSDLQSHTSGEFGGLGIEVGLEDGFIRVIAPFDDTPAQRAGVKAGDLIIKLGDQPVQGMGLADAVKLMRGKPGSELRLTVIREGEDKPLEIVVVRDIIRVASVKQRMLDGGIGYLRITQFQVNTGKDLQSAIEKLKAESEVNGVVLDLRNNPGGVLRAAVEVCDAFLDQGLIVYTQGRVANSELRYNATQNMLIDNSVPIVVLINQGSASASEIVAGALQDQARAVIMGVDSFGKGSVQTILPLTKQRALKLTTARYYTPLGRSIQAQGIVPDIYVAEADVNLKDSGNFIKERDLSGHLENAKAKAPDPSEALVSMVESDFQLYEALNLLKGLAVVKSAAAARQLKADTQTQ
ncbi:S41 family peptidase [uncultured Amphritea sp.]|uniref:S41 family peptidase n=1 Tax=uncultured Amphritea sp. TaxID=981605 RepID=UPI00260C3F40|nr:S41 family peptidase [uncultured Amphritea sp.]